jgi:hypothetical protein
VRLLRRILLTVAITFTVIFVGVQWIAPIALSFAKSDYSFVKTLYEFTPDKMNHWSLSQRVHGREEFLLLIKSIALPRSAETGIFKPAKPELQGVSERESSSTAGWDHCSPVFGRGQCRDDFLSEGLPEPCGCEPA